MYLTEYWNDDDDDDEILVPPHLNEQLKIIVDFENEKNDQENPDSSAN